MPNNSSRPNQFNDEQIISTSDGLGKLGFDFGFEANSVLVANDKATPVYLSFASTVGSTSGHKVKANESVALAGIRAGGISLASTSTSTGDFVRVLAVSA